MGRGRIFFVTRRNYNSTNISTISFDCWDIFSTLYCFINIYKRVEALNTRFWIFYVLTGTKVATKDSQLIIMVRNFIRTSRAQLLSVMAWRPMRLSAESWLALWHYCTSMVHFYRNNADCNAYIFDYSYYFCAPLLTKIIIVNGGHKFWISF